MSLNTIMIFAEGDESGPTTLTLELIRAARGVAANVEAFVLEDGSSMAESLGDHGVSKIHAMGGAEKS
jgi:electron transfer flavoprotein alpha subunit